MKQISLRLPDELHARLREAADASRRSLHGEILWRLDTDPDAHRTALPEVSQELTESERDALRQARERND